MEIHGSSLLGRHAQSQGEGHVFPGWFTPQCSLFVYRNQHRVPKHYDRLKSMQIEITEWQ